MPYSENSHTVTLTFSARMLPNVNATTLKIRDPARRVAQYEETTAWSNGYVLDTKTPEFVTSNAPAIKKVSGEIFSEHTKPFNALNLVEVIPVEWNQKSTTRASFGNDLKVTENKYRWIKLHGKLKNNDIAVCADPLYLSYFYKQYKGCKFYASHPQDPIVVRSSTGKNVGILMPMNI